MDRTIALLGAPSNIGIRPYDDGRPRGLDGAPAALRAHKLAARLRADDVGDVVPPPVRRFHTSDRPRPERGSHRPLFERHRRAGGACPVGRAFRSPPRRRLQHRLGCIVRRTGGIRFATRARLCWTATPISRLPRNLSRYFGCGHVCRLRNRTWRFCTCAACGDASGKWFRSCQSPGVLRRFVWRHLRSGRIACSRCAGYSRSLPFAVAAWPRRQPRHWSDSPAYRASGFTWMLTCWIPPVMPAVDSPEPSGLLVDELVSLVRPFVRDPRAVGLQLTIYDPQPGQRRHVCGNGSSACSNRLLLGAANDRAHLARSGSGVDERRVCAYLLQTGMQEYAATPGNKGVRVLRKTEDGVTHFWPVTSGIRGRDQAFRR